MTCLLGHRWSGWWSGSDGAWYRLCQRQCGEPYERRDDWQAGMVRAVWPYPPMR